MPAEVTQVSDVIIPERFMEYTLNRIEEVSAIRNSGIMTKIPGLEVPYGGSTVKMPFWNDIDGDDEVWTSGHETQPDKLTTEKDVAVILTRIKSWGAEDLSGMFAGSDPMIALGNMVSDYWIRKEQNTLLAILEGIFKSVSLKDNILDVPTEYLNNDMMVDAISLLGDVSQSLTGILTHSAVRADLHKKNLLSVKPGEPVSKDSPEFGTYLGRKLIVDDKAPRTGDGVYTTYLFGLGAVAFAEGKPSKPVEFERRGTKSLDILINRRQFIMHPRGVKWIGNAVKDTPSNEELAAGANWQRVFDPKNIHIVALRHKIGVAS
jgi:hypothetical protein